MKTVTVEFNVAVPESATDTQIENWVAFYVGASCQLSGENPMNDRDLSAISGSVRVTS